MKCDEIFAALAMLEKERGIPQSFMMGKIIQALTTAYKRDHEGVEYVVVDVDEEKKDLKMYVQKEIVEEVENPGSQISLEEAKRLSAKNELGGIVNIPVESVEFGRIAAGNGKLLVLTVGVPYRLQYVQGAGGLCGLVAVAGVILVAAGGQTQHKQGCQHKGYDLFHGNVLQNLNVPRREKKRG